MVATVGAGFNEGTEEGMEPDDLLCSRNAHDEGDGRTPTLVLCSPERAPSEGPRSTAAHRPTWVPFQERKIGELGKGSIKWMMLVRRAQSRINQATLENEIKN